GQRDVHAPIEQVPPHVVDVLWVGQGDLDDREPAVVRCRDAQRLYLVQHAPGLLVEVGPDLVPTFGVDLQPRERGGEGRHRGGTGVQVGRRNDLQAILQLLRTGNEREQGRVRLGQSADEDDVV